MKLTIKHTASLGLPTGRKDFVWFDDDISGFGIRIREGGSRTWIYRYRRGSKQRSITLGSISSVPLAVARANAGKLEAAVRLGGDPAMEKQAANLAADQALGVLAHSGRHSYWRRSRRND